MVDKGDIVRLKVSEGVFIVTLVNPYTKRIYGIYTDGSTFTRDAQELEERCEYEVIGHTDRIDNILYIIKNLNGALKCLERS